MVRLKRTRRSFVFTAVILLSFTFYAALPGALNPADIDNSGRVDLADFSFLGRQWQTDGTFDLSADIAPPGGDGQVDLADVAGLADNWLDQENRAELLYDDFETGFGHYTPGGDDCLLYTGGVYAHQGSNAVHLRDNHIEASFQLTEPLDIAGPGFSRLEVQFWYRAEIVEPGERFRLYYFDGTVWHLVRSWVAGTDFQNGQFYFASVVIPESQYVFAADMNIRFQCDATSVNDHFYIDEIRIAAAGGVGLILDAPEASAFEKEGWAARWTLRAIGNESSSAAVNFHVTGTTGDDHGAASAADYLLLDADGSPVSSPVTIPVPGVFEIVLQPVADGIAEPREDLVLSIDPGGYTVSGNDRAVSLYDAADLPENRDLLVAYLRPESSAQTTASGVGTLVINGPRTRALLTSSFHGLTSIQTASHLHYALPDDPENGVGPAIVSLPEGQFSNLEWEIRAAGGYSITEIIDALYRQNSLNIYLNVHTQSYPVGEIRGPFTKQEGSPQFIPPAAPPAHETLTGEALRRDVVRFLMQATFGPTQADIDALYDRIVTEHDGNRIAGYEAWIDDQLALDATSLATLLYYIDENELYKEGLIREEGVTFSTVYQTPTWVHWDLALHAHDQLRQRMAFALSEIVVISKVGNDTIYYVHYAPERYWDMLADHADGNYRDVLEDVSKSPLMGSYLSHLANQKTVTDPVTGETLVSPDENYAREIMQLFSIGLVELHPDGTLRLSESGAVQETYDNGDITELAKVFTGWGLSKNSNGDANNSFFLISIGPLLDNQRWLHPMKNFAAYHDTGAKSFLGADVPAGLDGEQDLQAALDILFNHPNAGPFLARRLIQRFVTSNPSRGYIYRAAQAFEDDGTGQRGSLKAVLKAILLDYEARSLTYADDPDNQSFGKVKEPIIAFIQFCRALNMAPDLSDNDLIDDLTARGYPADQADNFPPNWAVIGPLARSSSFGYGFEFDQRFMSAESVFNYYSPDFSAGNDINAAGLVSPELQIADEYTLTVRHREMWEKLYYASRDWPIDAAPLQQLYDAAKSGGATDLEAAEALVDHLDLLLTAGTLKADYGDAPAPNPRSIIIDTVAAQSGSLLTGKALTAPYLIVTSPSFNVQR